MSALHVPVRAATVAAALLLAPILTTVPAHADALPTLSVADVTAAEPAYGATAPLVFTPTLDAPATADTRVYVELWSELPGNPGLYARTGDARDLIIPAGATSIGATFTLRGDSYDSVHDYRYQARVSARSDQVANPSVVAQALVTDTTRDGTFHCITAPTGYDAMGVGTPIGMQYVDTTTGDPFTAWCNNGERHRAQYATPDGSLSLTDVSERQEVSPAYDLLTRTAPTAGDHALGSAEVGTAVLRIGDTTITLSGLASKVTATCATVGPPALFTIASSVAHVEVTTTVVVGGLPVVHREVYNPGTAPLQVHVGTVTLGFNVHEDENRTVLYGDQAGEVTHTVTSSAVTVHDDVRGDLGFLARTYLAAFEGNVCDA